MRIAVTGTPGTGKTSATNALETDLEIIHLNEVIEREKLYTEVDDVRNSFVADIEAIEKWLAEMDNVIIESHLAHYVESDLVVVLRCAPTTLIQRLTERGEPESKAQENAESEALDGILIEAIERHEADVIYEIDTTDRTPTETAAEIEAVLTGDREPSAGEVNFTDYL